MDSKNRVQTTSGLVTNDNLQFLDGCLDRTILDQVNHRMEGSEYVFLVFECYSTDASPDCDLHLTSEGTGRKYKIHPAGLIRNSEKWPESGILSDMMDFSESGRIS